MIAGGPINNVNSSVTATMHILNSKCFGPQQDIAFTGTVGKAGAISTAISFTSAKVSNQIVSVTGTVASSGNTELLSGTYSLSGGCGDGDKGTIQGFMVPAFTNTYSGTFGSISGLIVPVTLTLSQLGPDVHGLYQVSGTITFSGSRCFSTGSIISSTVTGGHLEVSISTDKNGAVEFVGDVVDLKGAIAGTYQVTAGGCFGDYGNGSVVH